MSDNAIQVAVKFTKLNDEQQTVFGWANVTVGIDGTPVKDIQDDIIETFELEMAVYDFVMSYSPTAGYNHQRPCGQLIESMMFTKEKIETLGIPAGVLPEGWWVGFKIWDTEVWLKVKSGELPGLSIGGSGVRINTETAGADT